MIVLWHGRYSYEQPVQIHLCPFFLPRGLRTHRCNQLRSLQTYDIAAHFLVHGEDLCCSAHAVLSTRSHRQKFVGSDDALLPASSVGVVARLPSCCALSCSACAPSLPGKYFPYFCYVFTHTCVLNFCPRSHLSFWSREEGWAFSPRVGLPILHPRAEFGIYSWVPLLPPAFRDRDGTAAVCLHRWCERFDV